MGRLSDEETTTFTPVESESKSRQKLSDAAIDSIIKATFLFLDDHLVYRFPSLALGTTEAEYKNAIRKPVASDDEWAKTIYDILDSCGAIIEEKKVPHHCTPRYSGARVLLGIFTNAHRTLRIV